MMMSSDDYDDDGDSDGDGSDDGSDDDNAWPNAEAGRIFMIVQAHCLRFKKTCILETNAGWLG